MHINDVYALRTQLGLVLCNQSVDRDTVAALLNAACDEIEVFEEHLEEMALREEAREMLE